MDDLLKAYLETDFIVYEPYMIIKVGKSNKALDELLMKNNCHSWAYITAWNPYSEITHPSVNHQQNIELRSDVTGFAVYEGEGVGTDPNWAPEKSFLILGIDRDDAILLGKKYKQNAIVFGTIQLPAELIWVQ